MVANILNNNFHWQERKRLVKNKTFSSELKNASTLPGMNDSLKNIRYKWKKMIFTSRKINFRQQRISSIFKPWFPIISVTISARRKKLKWGRRFLLLRKSFSSSRKEKFFQNAFSEKKLSLAGVSEKMYIKMLCTS